MGSSESKQRNSISVPRKSQIQVNQLPYYTDNNPNDASQRVVYNYHTGPQLEMPFQSTFQCSQCGIVFPTDEALYKHRLRFCVGNPEAGIRKHPTYLTNGLNHDPRRDNFLNNQTSSAKFNVYASPVDRKRDEINEWKNKRSVLQSVQDMEDRMLLESKKTEKMASDLKKRSLEYNLILNDYERLQVQENDLLRQMFNLHGQSRLYLSHPNDLTNYEKDQLEMLYRQNTRIKQERQYVQNRLERLITLDSPRTTPYDDPHRLLNELREQQERNEKTLSYIRRRLMHPNSSPLITNDTSSLPYISLHRQPTTDDVRILRNRYLQFGGHDAEILAQFSDLEKRMHTYEAYPATKDYPEPLKHYQYRPQPVREVTNDKLKTVINDRDRLQRDLSDMHRKYERLESRTRQLELTLATTGVLDSKLNDNSRRYFSSKSENYQPVTSLTRITRPNYTKSADNFLDQSQTFQYSSLPALTNSPRPNRIQSTARITPIANQKLEPLESKPYDPVGGFIIFFDFIIDLPPSIEKCQLITCLNHSLTGLGQPSQLEVSKSELFLDQKFNEQIGIVLIATRQPVPRCPPHQALSIIIEVLTTSKQNPGQPPRTNAWAKLPLFDTRNRLLSGRWKVPLKALPIQHDASFPVISTLPTFGRAQLHYRLVNFEDGNTQTNTPFSPSHRDLYLEPPQD